MNNLVLTNGKKSLNGMKRILLLVGLTVAAALPAQAADYVISYTSGGTTYYLGMNGTNLVAKTQFDPTCIWQGYYNGDYSLSTNTRINIRNKSNTSYYLYYSDGSVIASTTGQRRWYGGNGSSIYYNNGGTTRYIHNDGSTITASNSARGAFVPYEVTTTNVAEAITGSLSTPTITPSAAQTVEYGGSVSYTASATGPTRIVPAHTTYTFNNTTIYYYNNQAYTSTNAFATNNPAVTYTWALSGDGASALELMSTSGANTIVRYTGSASGTTATLTVTAKVLTTTRTASITINVTPVEPTAISATGTTVYVTGSGAVAYTLTPDYAYNRVNVASSNTGVFTVTSPATGGGVDITPVAAGEASLTLTALNSNGSNGPSTSVTVTVRDICAAPEFAFSQSGSSVVATLTCATTGATIRYTTDGTDPTPTTGTVYTGPFNVADGTNIKAIAIWGDYYDASEVATKKVSPIDYVVSGVSGDIVTLNDLEDHTWSYYSDADCPIRSLNPADVKITYYGNGTGTVSTTNGATPGNTSWTANASGVQVSSSETANTFVYYKTLERTDGSTSANPTGRCAYTTIPNPFSVRPTYQYATGTLNKYCGFYAWRVKSVSGGTIHTAATGGTQIDANGIINAETEVFFTPTSETGMTVELEALWARAYVVTSNTTTGLNNGVSYERNFVFLSSNTTLYNAALSYPVTYTTVDPATGEGTKRTITIRGGFTCDANTKFENVIFAQYNNNNQVITSNGHDLVIGRGCTGTINRVRGLAEDSDNDVSYILRVESGTFDNFDMLNNVGGTYGGVVALKAIIGNDYDRATANNTLLTLAENGIVYGKSNNAGNASVSFTSASNRNSKVFDWYVKSGTIQGSKLGDASADNALYLGHPSSDNSARYTGKRYLTVEGGNLANIAGGVNNYATNHENYAVNDGDPTIYIRIKGGTVRGSIYGAGAYGGSSGNVKYVFTGGTINGWVAGGCNGTQNTGGELYGLTSIYIGGKTNVVQSATDPRIGGTSDYGTNGAYGGNIFGAGCGIQPAAYNASNPGASLNTLTVGKVYGSTVVIADESVVGRDVYGGGNFGLVDDGTQSGWTNNPSKTANLYILGGTVKGNVYGGSNNQNGQIVKITMTGGTIEGGLYGGSNSWGTINNDVTMHIDGGQVGTSTQSANIHGGGYGSATRVLGSVNLALGKEDCSSVLDGVTVFGDVYGGSAEGRTNGNTGRTAGAETNVTLYHGTINGALYGGGLGSSSNPAIVYGPVAVKVYGGSVRTNDGSGENGSGGVFGCNNVNGTPQSTVTVDIYGTDPAPDANSFALFAVYGGGNRSHYTANVPVVTIHGCKNSIEYVYGGGNASNVPGTNVTIWGGHIGNAFGGGNGYSVTGNHDNASALHYNPGANITASGAHLTIHGGTIDAAFGGSNQWGTINGGINVTVEELTESANDPCTGAAYAPCSNIIVELYGGGNEAPAQGSDNSWISPSVTINSCDMKITNLFGGAKNANHGTDINLVVDKGQFQNVFGGNNLGGTITGNVTLTLNGGTMLNAFGGNNQGGNITGTITVTVDDAEDPDCPLRVDNVYGGGFQAAYTPTDATANTPLVNFVNGTVNNAVFGGGLGENAKITANPTVIIGGTGSDKAIVGAEKINGGQGVGNIYGGGSQADVLKNGDNTGNTSVTLSGNVEVKGNVYGGGNQADVQGNTNVELR